MKKLGDKDIVRMMREQYARRLRSLVETLDIDLVSHGLKVRDKTRIGGGQVNQYTVERCGKWGVELSYVDENGKVKYRKVGKETFERDFDTPAEVRREIRKDAEEEKDQDDEK